MRKLILLVALLAGTASAAVPFKNGTRFALKDVPGELVVERRAGDYDRLWTEERMRAVIAKAVKKGIALEIQAESPYPRPQFLKFAKEMGAKFSFGTNNFDPSPKDLSR